MHPLVVVSIILSVHRPLVNAGLKLLGRPPVRGPLGALAGALTATFCLAAWDSFEEWAEVHAPHLGRAAHAVHEVFYRRVLPPEGPSDPGPGT